MKIIEMKIMRGPNYWSIARKKLIVLTLDLEVLEETPTDKIRGFAERLHQLIPSIYSHRCSEGVEGGFLKRVKEGTWMGHVVEHVALEIQTLAGMDCGFGRTRETNDKGIYTVVFAYENENAGVYAAHAALRIVLSLVRNEAYDLEKDIAELRTIYQRERFGPSTQAIIDEALKRNIPYSRLNNDSLLLLGKGARQKIICASMTGDTSDIGVEIAGDKEKTKQILSGNFIPVPDGLVLNEKDQLDEAIKKIGFPLVVKPINGNHGRGITTNIVSKEQALIALTLAKKISDEVIIEKFIVGFDFRFLVINFKLVAVAKRTPAMVIGDGHSTIAELIEETNKDPNRGEGHEKVLTKIKIDHATHNILSEKKLSLDAVLSIGEILFLKNAANISTGGTSEDVTDMVHPHNFFLAERIARLLNLDICGIDVVTTDIKMPVTKKTGAILEVNASPGFRMHLAPSKGMPRNVAEPVIDMLFPNNAQSRIPIVAVTGTNGKTTTTRLIAHLAQMAGNTVGFTTTDGIYLNNELVTEGDCSGPASAAVVLRDPLVDFAVLECARGGILRSGLGFDQCDVSVITNITDDHLGLNGINSLEELARVKATVAHSTFANGYAVLNADDDLVYAMRNELHCQIALFSMKADNERIKRHCDKEGLAVIIEKNYFTLCKGKWKTRLIKVTNVPLTFSGTATCMIQNVLPAILTAFIMNFRNKDIINALRTFIPSQHLTPGRMNLFRFKNFRLMVDYVHNEGGYLELKKFLSFVKAPVKIGIIAATGDRRDKDIINIGNYAAQVFDEIIIRHDKDGRGRTNEELTKLLLEGIMNFNPGAKVTVISDEFEALEYAMNNAPSDAFILVSADNVHDTIDFVSRQLEKEKTEVINCA